MLAILDRDAQRGHPTRRHAAVLAALALLIVLPIAALGVARADAPASQDPPLATDDFEDRSIEADTDVPEPAPEPNPIPVEQLTAQAGESVARVERQQQDTGAQRVVAALLKARRSGGGRAVTRRTRSGTWRSPAR
jgi:hypothetical protein